MTKTSSAQMTHAMDAELAVRLSIGSFVRATREAQRLTQDEFATLTLGRPWQISRGAISAIERGRNLPSLPALVALHHILHIDPVEMFERSNGCAPASLEVGDADLSEKAASLVRAGDFRAALSLYETMLERLPRGGDKAARERLEAGIERNRAMALLRCGALYAARAAAERAITLAGDKRTIRAESYVVLSELQLRMGSVPLAADAAERAVMLSERDARVQMMALRAAAQCRFEEERYAEAISAFAKAREKAWEVCDFRHVIEATGNLGLCSKKLGQSRQGRAWLAEAIGLARRHAKPELEARWLVELGHLALDETRLEEADRLALSAVALAKPRRQWSTVLRAEWLRHLVFLVRNPDQVDRHRLGTLRRMLTRISPADTEPTVQELRCAILNLVGVRPSSERPAANRCDLPKEES